MSIWQTTPQIIPNENEGPFPRDAAPAGLQVEAGTGTVEVQTRDSSNAWAAIDTISASGGNKIDTANMPAIRIVATGDAKFRVTYK